MMKEGNKGRFVLALVRSDEGERVGEVPSGSGNYKCTQGWVTEGKRRGEVSFLLLSGAAGEKFITSKHIS